MKTSATGCRDQEAWEWDGTCTDCGRLLQWNGDGLGPETEDEAHCYECGNDRLIAEIKRLQKLGARQSEALRRIAMHGTSRPMEMGSGDDGDGWFRRIAFNCIGMAARALDGAPTETVGWILWECDCGAEFETSARRGPRVVCPECGAREDEPGKDGMGPLEVLDSGDGAPMERTPADSTETVDAMDKTRSKTTPRNA